ncbi:MAG TPA: hypothetical protein VNN18_10580 [Candidatus Xenobia bacterium]|nr:hypothetical protein [Candidatus Xenobia bacterium]
MKALPAYMVTLALVLGAALALATPPELKVLRLDFVVIREHKNQQGQLVREVMERTRFIAPDGRYRTHTEPAEKMTYPVQIVDPRRDVSILLNPSQNVAIRTWQARSKRMLEAEQQDTKRQGDPLGPRIMQGLDCNAFRVSHPNGRTTEFAYCRDPVSGAKFQGSFFARLPDGSNWREELQRVTRDYTVDKTLFEIPAHFRIIDQ